MDIENEPGVESFVLAKYPNYGDYTTFKEPDNYWLLHGFDPTVNYFWEQKHTRSHESLLLVIALD